VRQGTAQKARQGTAQKARRRLRRLCARRCLRLSELLLELGDAVLGLAERHVLDQHGLDQQIERVRMLHPTLADELIRLRVLRLRWCLL
jgi:hypothetical protein